MDGESKSRMLTFAILGSVAGISAVLLLYGFASDSGLKLPRDMAKDLPRFMPFSRAPEEPVISGAQSAGIFPNGTLSSAIWTGENRPSESGEGDGTVSRRSQRLERFGRIDANRSLDALLHALKNDDVCDVARVLSGFEPSYLASGILRRMGHSFGDFDELLGEEGPWRGKVMEGSRRFPTRFFNALLLADMLDGVPSHAIDAHRSRQILKELEHEDPDNGAYPYFRLGVERKLGFSERELRETVRDIVRAPKFDTFIADMTKEIHKLGWETPSLHLFTRSILSTHPVPNFLPTRDVLRDLAARFEMRDDLRSIARLLMAGGFSAERGYQSYGFFPVEYEVGRSLWRSFLNTAVEPLPLSFRELSAAKENRDPSDPWPDEQLINSSSCQRRTYEDFFAQYRRRF